MGKRKTTEQFIKEAKQVHGDKYDYSQVEYKNAHSKVKIICKDHGIFEQAPHEHLAGQGCPKCPKAKIPKSFDKRACSSKSEIKTLGEIKRKWCRYECPYHGVFDRRKSDFEKSPYGCQICSRIIATEKRYKKPFSEFLKQAKEIHRDEYIYPTDIEYYYNNDKINIFCKKHKEYFSQTISDHLNGSGCPKCGFEKTLEARKLTTEEVVKRCIEVRGTENYDYSNVVWKESTDKINIFCKTHNKLFSVRYYDFIAGVNCPDCAKEIQKQKFKETWARKNISATFDTEGFIEKAKKVRPEFDYSKTVFKGRDKSVIVIFNGREYSILARSLLEGKDPFELSLIKRGIKKSQNRWKNLEKELKDIHGDKYEYLKEEIDYIKSGKAGIRTTLHIKCKKHGIFEQNFIDHMQGHGCKKCAIENRPVINSSAAEKEMLNFIKTFYSGTIMPNNREILEGKELDIYFPEKKLAIEYDGLFWHNNIDNSYKFEECRRKGIRLIRITEPEWIRNNEKIRYFLKSTFGIYDKKIFARKCVIKEINEEYESFCIENDLTGYKEASLKLGLYFQEELVQIMSFEGNEIIRDCSKLGYSIIGGKEKLLKHCGLNEITVSIEKDKFSGKSYYRNGFVLIKETKPDYICYQGKDYIPLQKEIKGCKRLFDYGKCILYKE